MRKSCFNKSRLVFVLKYPLLVIPFLIAPSTEFTFFTVSGHLMCVFTVLATMTPKFLSLPASSNPLSVCLKFLGFVPLCITLPLLSFATLLFTHSIHEEPPGGFIFTVLFVYIYFTSLTIYIIVTAQLQYA